MEVAKREALVRGVAFELGRARTWRSATSVTATHLRNISLTFFAGLARWVRGGASWEAVEVSTINLCDWHLAFWIETRGTKGPQT